MATQQLHTIEQPMFRRAERFRLTISGGTDDGVFVEGAGDVVRVGSLPGNSLVLANETVSRLHFEIETTPLGFKLRDLGSTNGTFVDGYRAIEMYLPQRARLQAGETQLVFEALGEDVHIELSADARFGDALGRSASMREVFSLLEKVAPRDLTVLLEGESGTGKERLAEAIHQRSSRAGKKFVVFDCASVPATLMESELLGHERGAFTGAQGRRVGRFEEAQGGTLFLDEIGELPLELQPKLLRALEQREIRRVGGSDLTSVDVRVVAATNRDLAREMARGAFREDLYYRLAVIRVRVPPLRERTDDIALLVESFVRELLDGDDTQAMAILGRVSDADWQQLIGAPWPGNVRELRNFVERSLAVSDGLNPALLPRHVHAPDPGELVNPGALRPTAIEQDESGPRQVSPTSAPSIDLERGFIEAREELLGNFERAYLEAMLSRHGGNISRAARAAGLDRMHFKRLLARHQRND